MDIQMNNVIMILIGPHSLFKGLHSSQLDRGDSGRDPPQ